MRAEVLEETIRLEIEQQADMSGANASPLGRSHQERFGVNYYELSPNVQSWLRSLVVAQLYGKDTAPAVSLETGEEE
jgi:hypothetical protein